MSKHSPTPWRVGPVDDTLVSDADGRAVAAACARDYGKDWELIEANARLIVAAPELLEALKGVLEIEGWDMAHPRYTAARAAIAKAEGGA
jgi:hypothetical protein